MRFAFAAVIVLALGCGSASELEGTGVSTEVRTEKACRPETCSGCCDEYGVCRETSAWYCGVNAAACLRCQGNSTCSPEGQCVGTPPVQAPSAPSSPQPILDEVEACPNRPACGM